MLRTETVRLVDQYKGIREIAKQLDPTNIKILTAMWKFGPRNLLEVSRRTGIPFTTVYHRVAKLEARSRRIASMIPQISRLGMIRLVVLVTARPGYEERTTTALKISNFWWSMNPCEGAFTHQSVHAIPAKFLKEFRRYVRHLSDRGLITQFRIIPTGEYFPNFPDFGYYNPTAREWTFEWSRWLRALGRGAPCKRIDDPEGYPILVDKKDVLIVKELEKNARKSFADLAPMLGISLQGVKYHYDKKLLASGIVRHFQFDVVPYPMEISAYHEVMLEFASNRAMNRFFSLLSELFFIVGVAKVLRRNALIARTYIPQSQLSSMLAFFSQMAEAGILESYSLVRLDLARRQMQTISYELFDDEKGWTFDLKRCLSELTRLT